MTDASNSFAKMLRNPTVWFVFLFLELVVASWLLRLALPGDPNSFPIWAKVGVLVGLIALLTAMNMWIRRRWLDPAGR